MTRPYKPEPRGNKPMTQQYRTVMAGAARIFRDDKLLTDEERDELIRKAGGQ